MGGPVSCGRLAILCTLLAAGALRPSIAWAQATVEPAPAPPPREPPDAIYLKGGGILRGTIVEALPGAPARIQLVTGEIATVDAGNIARIAHGEGVAAPSPSPPDGAASSAAPATPGPTAIVHLEASDDARLERDITGDGNWVSVCAAPCDKPLPISGDYRIGGSTMRPSRVFRLPGAQGDRVLVTASGGSKAGFYGGIALTAVSGPVVFVSFFIAGIASLVASSSGDHGAATAAAAGWTVFAVSAAGLIGGIVLIVNNARTGVEAGERAPGAPVDAWRWTPTWHEASLAAPPVLGVPVLSGAF
jgi:hypothetical protein